MNKPDNTEGNKLLWKYAGLTVQILVSIGVALWLGMKADKWLAFSMPLLVWILPLLVIIVLLYQVIKDTSKKR